MKVNPNALETRKKKRWTNNLFHIDWTMMLFLGRWFLNFSFLVDKKWLNINLYFTMGRINIKFSVKIQAESVSRPSFFQPFVHLNQPIWDTLHSLRIHVGGKRKVVYFLEFENIPPGTHRGNGSSGKYHVRVCMRVLYSSYKGELPPFYKYLAYSSLAFFIPYHIVLTVM